MKKIVSSLALVVGFGLAACSSDASNDAPAKGGTTPPPTTVPSPVTPSGTLDALSLPTPPGPGNSMIRTIHASADAPSVDVYVKGNPAPIATNIAYGQTSGWLEVPAGSYIIELRAAPSKATDPVVYVTAPVVLAEGVLVSALASGLLASNDADASFRILPVPERFADVPKDGVKIRVVHAGADAPSVDLDVGNDDPTKPEISGLARFATTEGQVSLPANETLPLGIAAGGVRVTAFAAPKLPSGAQVLVIATGLLGRLPREADGFSLLAIGPNGSVGFIKQNPTIYALHASPDAPAIDAFAGDAELVDDLSFGELSMPIQVAPGAYTLDVFATTAGATRPSGPPAASGTTGDLVAGERYLAEATGFLGKGGFRIASYRDGFDRDATKAVLRAVHGSPDAPAVDIGALANGTIGAVLFPDLTFGRASDEKGLAAAPGHLVVGVAPVGTTAPVASFTIPATSGERAFTVAAGALAPAAGEAFFRLLVVDTSATPWTVTPVHPH